MNQRGRSFQAAGGYLLDLSRLARGIPINPHSYLKYFTISSLRKRTGAEIFVETGTFRGVTTARCASIFDRVISVELDDTLAREATRYLSSYKNVRVICGDAVRVLPGIMDDEECKRVILFLDGHFSGKGTAHGEVAEPAIILLESLKNHTDKICGIVIDDFRCFGADSGIPKKSKLIETIEHCFPKPRFDFFILSDLVIVENKER